MEAILQVVQQPQGQQPPPQQPPTPGLKAASMGRQRSLCSSQSS
jgi:hypothetical protein